MIYVIEMQVFPVYEFVKHVWIECLCHEWSHDIPKAPASVRQHFQTSMKPLNQVNSGYMIKMATTPLYGETIYESSLELKGQWHWTLACSFWRWHYVGFNLLYDQVNIPNACMYMNIYLYNYYR